MSSREQGKRRAAAVTAALAASAVAATAGFSLVARDITLAARAGEPSTSSVQDTVTTTRATDDDHDDHGYEHGNERGDDHDDHDEDGGPTRSSGAVQAPALTSSNGGPQATTSGS